MRGRLEIARIPTLTVMKLDTESSRNIHPAPARQRLRAAFIASIACASLACAARDLDERDLGNTSPPLVVADDPAVPGERLPVVRGDGSIDPFVEGVWVGRAENLFAPSGPAGARPAYVFPSGSADFTLDISLADPTIPGGQIVFGSGAIPQPQAGVPYPPGFGALAASFGSPGPFLPPQEGRAYPLNEQIMRLAEDAGDGAGALALSYPSNWAYVDWCALQSPRPTGDGRYDCLRYSDPDDEQASCSHVASDGAESRFDCDLGALCGAPNVCECTESSCQVAGGAYAHIWLVRDDDDLLGTFVGAVFDHGNSGRSLPVGTVRFQRVNP
jgi:hypothetical protein